MSQNEFSIQEWNRGTNEKLINFPSKKKRTIDENH